MSLVTEPLSSILSENRKTLDTGVAKGAFRCAGCGYGIVSYRSLPACPMCRETSWEPTPWRPFTRHSIEL